MASDESRSKVGPPRSKPDPRQYSKDSTKHWLTRLKKRRNSPDWHIRVSHQNTQHWVNLKTGNKSVAADRALAFWRSLSESDSWETARRAIGQVYRPKGVATVGEWIEVFGQTFVDVDPRTVGVYAGCLRTIVADIAKVTHEAFPHREDWREAVNQVSLSMLTKGAVESYMLRRLKGVSREELFRARRSLHTCLRNARNLFTEKRRTEVPLTLPSPPPFEGVDIKPWKAQRYHSEINLELLMVAGESELPHDQLLVLVLASCAGLRKEEMDRLSWAQVNFEGPSITIKPTQFYKPKSESSIRIVPIADDVADLLRKDPNPGEFVLPGPFPNLGANYYHYRANQTFLALGKWLRQKGVTATQPIHALRKEYGSQINKVAGLKAASDLLGHAEIGITASTYVESRERVVIKMHS